MKKKNSPRAESASKIDSNLSPGFELFAASRSRPQRPAPKVEGFRFPDNGGFLHDPSRIDHMGDLECHATKAARLSRALWDALCNYDASYDDERSRNALIELASDVADHTSAIEYLFYESTSSKDG
jgi:hypothetical protein